MQKRAYPDFGNLITKKNKLYDIEKILKNDDTALNILFQNSADKLEKLTVIESERKIALENLRNLTTILQTKRLRDKVKSSNKYFTL